MHTEHQIQLTMTFYIWQCIASGVQLGPGIVIYEFTIMNHATLPCLMCAISIYVHVSMSKWLS